MFEYWGTPSLEWCLGQRNWMLMNLVPWDSSLQTAGRLLAKWRSTSLGMLLAVCRKQDLEKLAARDHALAGREVGVECRVPSWSLFVFAAGLPWEIISFTVKSLSDYCPFFSWAPPGHLPPCDHFSELNKRAAHFVSRSWGSCLGFVVFLWHNFSL